MFYNRCLFFFNFATPRDLRAQLPDRRETLPRDEFLAEFYNASPKKSGDGRQKHEKF